MILSFLEKILLTSRHQVCSNQITAIAIDVADYLVKACFGVPGHQYWSIGVLEH